MLQCKFCRLTEEIGEIDFYICKECESMMCHVCAETSIKTGQDYCWYCKKNLQWEGKWL